jgi:hypothetical protein
MKKNVMISLRNCDKEYWERYHMKRLIVIGGPIGFIMCSSGHAHIRFGADKFDGSLLLARARKIYQKSKKNLPTATLAVGSDGTALL